MVTILNEKDLNKIANKFSKIFIKMVSKDSRNKILDELKKRANFNYNNLYYFNLDDDVVFIFQHESETTWGTIKALTEK